MHNTISQFIDLLASERELSLKNIFIDGMLLESFANRYRFAWGKRVEKERAKMQGKLKQELPEIACDMGVRFGYDIEIGSHQLRKFMKCLEAKHKENDTVFVYGKVKSPY